MPVKNQRIAVIGGGPTGLALAYFLGRAGSKATIIERGHELSGLLAFTNIQGQPIERFYHHFFTHDRYLLDLLDELGLSQHILWQSSASAVYATGQLFPAVTKADYLRLPFLSLSTKLRAGFAAVQMRGQRPENLPPTLTAETYLRRLFGQAGWEKMWRPLLVNKFGEQNSHRISAQWIAKRISIRSQSERRGREVLGYLDGSYRLLFDGLRQAILKQGGQILLKTEVTSLPRTPNGQYLIHGQAYDAVVSTIAPDLIKTIVPDLDLPSVPYQAAIAPLFFLRTSVTPYYWINMLDSTIPFSVIVNQQALMPSNYYRGLWPLYIGHYLSPTSDLLAKSNEELYHYYLAHLQKIFPGIEQEIVSYEINRTKYAQPIVTAPWTPLPHTTNLPHLYTTSMAHIFPEDRGVNYSIREAQRIVTLLTETT